MGTDQARKVALVALAIGACFVTPAKCAAEVSMVTVEQSQVTLHVSSQPQAVTLCVTALPKVKISAVYGVTIDAEPPEAWVETFPLTFYGENWDFDLPLKIELRSRASDTPRHLTAKLGACSDHCEMLVFNFTLPPPSPDASAPDVVCQR